ncbi:MAG: amidinotransferase, partial [Actinomycetota bacterium]
MSGVDSMVGRLDRVMMRRPGAILDADPERWHYAHPIDADALARQFDGLVATLHAHQVEIDWLDDTDAAPDDGLADSVFTFDPSFMIPA